MVVRLNETARPESSDLPLISPSHRPGIRPDDSRQEANTSRFTDCSEAQIPSVADDDICGASCACTRAASGHAAAPPSGAMNSRRRMRIAA